MYHRGLESSLLSTVVKFLIDAGAEDFKDSHLFLVEEEAKMRTLIEIMRISPEIAECKKTFW